MRLALRLDGIDLEGPWNAMLATLLFYVGIGNSPAHSLKSIFEESTFVLVEQPLDPQHDPGSSAL